MNDTNDIDFYERLYSNVKVLAKINNLRMDKIEIDSGISVGYLSKMARTKKGLALHKAIKLADVLGVSLNQLLIEDYLDIYKEELAERELDEAVNRAKRIMQGADVVKVVKRILDKTDKE